MVATENGNAVRVSHNEAQIRDHEQRIRALEVVRWRQTGITATLAAFGAVGGSLLLKLFGG